jgi:hypothetical protein
MADALIKKMLFFLKPSANVNVNFRRFFSPKLIWSPWLQAKNREGGVHPAVLHVTPKERKSKASKVIWGHGDLGPMLWIFKFLQKKLSKIWLFDSEQSQIMQKFDHNIVLWDKRQFSAENFQKSQKIVIITSSPDWAIFSLGRF